MDSSTEDMLTVQRFMERYAEEKELGFSKVCTMFAATYAACFAACVVNPPHRLTSANIMDLCACAELSEYIAVRIPDDSTDIAHRLWCGTPEREQMCNGLPRPHLVVYRHDFSRVGT